jgi:spoIIIJ-associated protein
VEGVEAEGRTVNEATENALQQMGLRREQVDVEVLSEGRPRLLGFRGEPARVRVTALPPPPAPTPRPVREVSEPEDEDEEDYEDEEEGDEDDDEEEYEDDEDEESEDQDEDEEYEDEDDEEEEPIPAPVRRAPVAEVKPVPVNDEDVASAVAVLQNLLRLMAVEADVVSRAPETAGDGIGLTEAVLDVEGDDLGLLIGRRGQTLASLQYLVNLIVSKQTNRRVAFAVDVDGYRRRREEALVGLAKRTAARVRGTGRSVTLEPMPPNERRIVHLALQDDPAVVTVSIGEGEARKVAITPSR